MFCRLCIVAVGIVVFCQSASAQMCQRGQCQGGLSQGGLGLGPDLTDHQKEIYRSKSLCEALFDGRQANMEARANERVRRLELIQMVAERKREQERWSSQYAADREPWRDQYSARKQKRTNKHNVSQPGERSWKLAGVEDWPAALQKDEFAAARYVLEAALAKSADLHFRPQEQVEIESTVRSLRCGLKAAVHETSAMEFIHTKQLLDQIEQQLRNGAQPVHASKAATET